MEVKVFKATKEGNPKAYASVSGDFAGGKVWLTGIKLMLGKNGYFVSMPSNKVKDEYKDIFFFDKGGKQTITDAILEEANAKGIITEEAGKEPKGVDATDIPF